jgi:hypothetical protein
MTPEDVILFFQKLDMTNYTLFAILFILLLIWLEVRKNVH